MAQLDHPALDRPVPKPLRAALRTYLERVVDAPDADPPAWLGERKPTELFCWPSLFLESWSGVQGEPDFPQPWVNVWHELLREQQRKGEVPPCYLEGAPGMGKTLHLRMVARELALEVLGRQEPGRGRWARCGRPLLPILLRLPALAHAGELRAGIMALTSGILATTPDAPAAEPLADLLLRAMQEGGACLLLDALDEVPDPHRCVQALAPVRPGMGFVLITARPGCRAVYPLPGTPRLFEFDTLDEWRQQRFLRAWGLPEAAQALIESSGPLASVGQSPLLLSLACAALERGELGARPGRAKVYSVLFDQVLEGGWQPSHGPVMADWETVLPETAWRLFAPAPGRNDFARQEVNAALQAATGDTQAEIDARREALAERGVLSPNGDRWGFPHRSFLEYFVARHWARLLESGSPAERDQLWSAIDAGAGFPVWTEPLLFLAGLAAKPEPLLTRLADPDRDDLARHRLALAARCLGELPDGPHGAADIRDRIGGEYLSVWLEHQRRSTKPILPDAGPALCALARAGVRVEGKELPEYAAGLLSRPEQQGAGYWMVNELQSAAATPAVLSLIPRLLADPDQDAWRTGCSLAIGFEDVAPAPELLQALVARLTGSDPDYWAEAADTLMHLGPAAGLPEAREPLLARLLDPASFVRTYCAEALERLYPDGASQVARVLAAALEGGPSPEDQVRRDLSLEVLETCWARLAVCPRVMDALLTLWKNGHPRAPAALRSVAEEAALAETVDALAPLLSGPTRRRELVLAGVFAELGVGAREYLPARELARLLRDPDPEVRGQAVRIARMQDRQGEPGTTELLRELLDSLDEDADLPVMLAAAELGRRTAGPAWESTLTQWMESADPQRRVRAARVVEALCWRPPRGFVCALPLRLARRFAMLVRDGAPEVRAVAVGVLLRLGTRGMGRGSAALLSDQLDATDAGTVKAALNGLTHTPPPERTSELTARVNALLAHADAEVREETIGLLRAWGPDTTPDLGRRLLAACTDPDEEVADAAAYALAALPGGGGTEVQDGLLLLALDPRSEVRAAAASALRGSSELPPGPEQLACLCRLLDDPVDTVRNLAAWAVEGFQRQGIRLQRIP